MDIQKILNSLSPVERQVFPVLKDCSDFDNITKKIDIDPISIMRALQWLENKKLIEVNTVVQEIISLDSNGVIYKKKGLPEFVFLKSIKDKMKLSKVVKKSGVSSNEVNICIGSLKKCKAIDVKKEDELIISLTKSGEKMVACSMPEEDLLNKLSVCKVVDDLTKEEKIILNDFIKRKKIVKKENKKIRTIKITKLGQKLIDNWDDSIDLIEKNSIGVLKKEEWKEKEFRRYDVKINVPTINGGKRHFVNQAIEYAKRIWLDMGFSEMTGDMVDTSFWVFDSLFTAQDHPVREMQDTFFIKDPEFGKLPKKEIVDGVKQAHEKGFDGSTGWNYKWDENEAKRNVLRTHTTVLSAKTLAMLKEYKESGKKGKYFALGRNFRNETVDWSHLFEFNQTEGIVIDPNANFRHLLGYLKEFFKKMGYPDARFRPAFFSYTEPSVEIDVFHPVHKKWIEFGGAGIFRPEVVIPLLGKDVPVLAWGPGFDRIYLDYYKINDIRELYKNDIKKLRSAKMWMK